MSTPYSFLWSTMRDSQVSCSVLQRSHFGAIAGVPVVCAHALGDTLVIIRHLVYNVVLVKA